MNATIPFYSRSSSQFNKYKKKNPENEKTKCPPNFKCISLKNLCCCPYRRHAEFEASFGILDSSSKEKVKLDI